MGGSRAAGSGKAHSCAVYIGFCCAFFPCSRVKDIPDGSRRRPPRCKDPKHSNSHEISCDHLVHDVTATTSAIPAVGVLLQLNDNVATAAAAPPPPPWALAFPPLLAAFLREFRKEL